MWDHTGFFLCDRLISLGIMSSRFIHCNNLHVSESPSFFKAESYCFACLDHIFFIQLLIRSIASAFRLL